MPILKTLVSSEGCILKYKIFLPIALLWLSFVNNAFALDVVKLNPGRSSSDIRSLFKIETIETALKLTEAEYGVYKLEVDDALTTNARAIQELQTGEKINTFVALTNQTWEENTIAVKVPIRRGILNYRLLMVHKDSLDKFKDVQNINDLKELNVGLLRDWETTSVMRKNKFRVALSHSYNGLFSVLANKRIDYIPRGVNEIYDEIAQNPDKDILMVEPNLALYIPAVTYIFVSPKNERLAERLTKGLEKMVASAQLTELFDKYYAKKIEQANLADRRIIYLKNPNLPSNTPVERKEFWFENTIMFY